MHWLHAMLPSILPPVPSFALPSIPFPSLPLVEVVVLDSLRLLLRLLRYHHLLLPLIVRPSRPSRPS